jgi:uncharacterized membrane protein YoaK (UPF0700 family)
VESVLPPVLLAQTAVSGVIDAVSYLGLGHVFTANMTGNVVLLAFAAAGASGLSVPRSGTALVAFLVGAVVGGRIATRMSAGPWYRWTGVAFGGEAILFLMAAIVTLGGAADISTKAVSYAIIAATGIAMGLRSATVRKIGILDLPTTVLTLTLAGLGADSTLAGGSNPNWQRRVGSVVSMFVGAGVGVYLLRYQIALPLGLCAVVSGACAVAAYVGLRRAAQASAATPIR